LLKLNPTDADTLVQHFRNVSSFLKAAKRHEPTETAAYQAQFKTCYCNYAHSTFQQILAKRTCIVANNEGEQNVLQQKFNLVNNFYT